MDVIVVSVCTTEVTLLCLLNFVVVHVTHGELQCLRVEYSWLWVLILLCLFGKGTAAELQYWDYKKGYVKLGNKVWRNYSYFAVPSSVLTSPLVKWTPWLHHKAQVKQWFLLSALNMCWTASKLTAVPLLESCFESRMWHCKLLVAGCSCMSLSGWDIIF